MSRFFHRPYPSANTILLDGGILIDPGSAPERPHLDTWLAHAPVTRVVNTHWHIDHSGANQAFRGRGATLAAPAAEAQALAAQHPDACRARWLDQVMTPYQVDHPLIPHDTIDGWTVVPLPGHTAHQVGLFHPGARVLIAGDSLHDNDVGWLDLDADPAALDQAHATLETIAALAPALVMSGHGPAITDLVSALARARRRLATWRQDPERIAWHACKRILTHSLMTDDGIGRAALLPRLVAAPWLQDHAARAFGLTPDAFAPLLLDEMLRSGAARWDGDRLLPTGDYSRPSASD